MLQGLSRTLAAAAVALPVLALPAHAADRTIAILQALTGVGAFIGVGITEGAEYAAEEINASGALGADKIKIVKEDDGSDRATTTAAMQRLANNKDVLLVLGPTLGPTAMTVAPLVNDAKFPMYTIGNTDTILDSGPWAFIAAQPAVFTMPLLGDYVLNTLKVKNCSMVSLSDNDAYVRLRQVFVEYVVPKGINLVDDTSVKSSETDFNALATRIVAKNPDCVFLFTIAPIAASLTQQLRQAGLPDDVKLIGHTALASPDLVRIGGKAVEGVYLIADWAPGGSDEQGRKFAEGFEKKYGHAPDNWMALGYSYMHVVADALKRAGAEPTRQSLRDALAKTTDVPVVVGSHTYTLTADKRLPKYGVNVLQVKDGKFVPAPK